MAEELRLDAVVVDKFSKPLADLRKKLQDVKPGSGVKDIRREFGELHTQLQRVSSILTGPVRSALTGIGISSVAAGASIAGIAAGLKSFAGNVSELKALNQETKISVENFRRLRAAAPFFGLQADQMDAGLRKFAENMHQFAKGKGEAFSEIMGKWGALGKGLQESLNKGDINGALDKALDGIIQERQRDPQSARQYAQLLFGNPDISSLGARGREKFREIMGEIARKMKPLTQAQLNSAEDLSDSIIRLQRAFDNLGNKVANDVAPALTPLMEQFARWVQMNKGSVGTAIKDSIEGFSQAVKDGTLERIGDKVSTIGKGFFYMAKGLVATVEAIQKVDSFLFDDKDEDRRKFKGQSSLNPATRLAQEKEKLAQMERWLAENGDASGPMVQGMRRQRDQQREVVRQMEQAVKDGTKEGIKDGLREMFQLQSFTASMGGGARLWNASFGGAATSFGGGMGGPRLGGGGRASGGMRVPGGAARDAGTAFNDGNAFFDAIIKAEGTAKYGDPYNTSLGYLKSPKPLTSMTMSESLAWGDVVRRKMGLNSSAKGAFQIVNTTQRKAMAALGLTGDDLFNEENQRRMASWIAHHQGLGAWEGFKAHPGQRARAFAALGRGEDRRTAMPYDWPAEWKMRGAYDAAAGAGVVGGSAGEGGKGRLDMYVHGLPGNWRMRAETGGLFREFSVNRGRNMAASSEEN